MSVSHYDDVLQLRALDNIKYKIKWIHFYDYFVVSLTSKVQSFSYISPGVGLFFSLYVYLGSFFN